MHLPYKCLIFSVCLYFLVPGRAHSQSNIDFFFKNSAQYKDVVVKEIRSTNTFVLQEKVGEKGEVIKLIGLSAPDAPKKKTEDIKRDQFGFTIKEEVSPFTTIEESAMEYVKELVEGQHVRLEFDAEKNSEDFITLAYIFLLKDDTFVNAEILRQGFANLHIRPPNTKYASQLREAYKEARAEKRGLQGQ